MFRILITKLNENSHFGSFHFVYIYYFQMKNILKHKNDLKHLEEKKINFLKSPKYCIIKCIPFLQISISPRNWTTF